jgi:hypothetical protein
MRELGKVVRRWWRHHKRHHKPGHHPHYIHDYHGKFSVLKRLFHRIEAWVWHLYLPHNDVSFDDTHLERSNLPGGCIVKNSRQGHSGPLISLGGNGDESNTEITQQFDHMHGFYEILSRTMVEYDILEGHEHKGHPDKRHRKWRKALFQAIRHIHIVNEKLRSFERGLISEEGIKDREWFKHLGVAPGKWLGYGATTLPGLTEAIIFDQDKDAAKYEVQRLIDLLEKMTARLNK